MREAYRLGTSEVEATVCKQRSALQYIWLIQWEVRAYIDGFQEEPQRGQEGGGKLQEGARG